MVVPDKIFTVILDTAIQVDAPVIQGLMEDLRDNDIHLEQWLGDSFTAAKDHRHANGDSFPISVSDDIVILATTVELVNDTSVSASWVNVDISGDTGGDTAVLAILSITIEGEDPTFGGTAPDQGDFLALDVRKDGDTPTHTAGVASGLSYDGPSDDAWVFAKGFAIVGLTSEIFEYRFNAIGWAPNTERGIIELIGYIV